MRTIPENNLLYPVLISSEEGGSGSGFFFRQPGSKKLFLATAAHVLFDQSRDALWSSTVDLSIPDRNLKNSPTEMTADLTQLKVRKKSTQDVAVVEIGLVKDEGGKTDINFYKGVSITSIRSNALVIYYGQEAFLKMDEVLIGNDVFVLGYPKSLGDSKQIEPNKPLLRKGIIAGINNENETIIIDCPVYFGNSGGLVIQVEDVAENSKYRAIGVVSEYIPFVEELTSNLRYTNVSYENSGYAVVVPTDTIFELTREEPDKLKDPKSKK